MNLLLLAVVFFIPFGAGYGFGFEQIKVLFFIFSISLIGFIWLFRKPKLKLSSIKITSGIFILILFITSTAGIDLKSSFLGSNLYFQGWILYAYLLLFAWIVSQVKIRLTHVAYALTGSAFFVSFLAIKEGVLLNFFATPHNRCCHCYHRGNASS